MHQPQFPQLHVHQHVHVIPRLAPPVRPIRMQRHQGRHRSNSYVSWLSCLVRDDLVRRIGQASYYRPRHASAVVLDGRRAGR